MSESFIQLAPDSSGKKAHTNQRTIGANDVQDEYVIPGEYPYASYIATSGGTAVSVATVNDHLMALMAGSSLNVRVRRIRVVQHANATTASVGAIQVLRLTTAGSGGTSVTPARLDTGDAASGATAMTLPSSKGTESTILLQESVNWRQTAPAGGGPNTLFEWVQQPGSKPILILAGTSNGIAVKSMNATAAATVNVWIEFVETNFAG